MRFFWRFSSRRVRVHSRLSSSISSPNKEILSNKRNNIDETRPKIAQTNPRIASSQSLLPTRILVNRRLIWNSYFLLLFGKEREKESYAKNKSAIDEEIYRTQLDSSSLAAVVFVVGAEGNSGSVQTGGKQSRLR